MKRLKSAILANATQLIALLLIIVTYSMARLPEPSDAERARLASMYRFSSQVLPTLESPQSQRTVRQVHPSLESVSGWISTVGAAVALSDLDHDGLSNDICYIDTRSDLVIVTPVPGTGDRYAPFALDPSPLEYDASTTAPMGIVPGDLNEDGQMDLLVYFWGRTPILYISTGKMQYTPVDILNSSERWFTNAATLADLDGDGHQDIIIGNYFQDNARILDAQATGVEAMQSSMSRAFNGGRNRLLLWSGISNSRHSAPIYVEATEGLDDNAAKSWTLALGAADLDGDLLPEIYFANDFGPDCLLHNRSTPGKLLFTRLVGEESFDDPSSCVLGKDSFKGMGVDFADINHDGFLDIYVSNIAAEYALQESHFLWLSSGNTELMRQGIAPYENASEVLGLSRSDWSWDSRLADFNNDGVCEALQATGFMNGPIDRWPELHELAMSNDQVVSNPKMWARFQPGDNVSGNVANFFFAADQTGRYVNIAQEIGLTRTDATRGIAVGDVDGDGDLDFVEANQWDDSYFYENNSPDPGKSLILRLMLPLTDELSAGENSETEVIVPEAFTTNAYRDAIGATVSVTIPGGRTAVDQVDGGAGHSGVNSTELHFGLAQIADGILLDVSIRWRSATGIVLQDRLSLSPGHHIIILKKPEPESKNL